MAVPATTGPAGDRLTATPGAPPSWAAAGLTPTGANASANASPANPSPKSPANSSVNRRWPVIGLLSSPASATGGSATGSGAWRIQASGSRPVGASWLAPPAARPGPAARLDLAGTGACPRRRDADQRPAAPARRRHDRERYRSRPHRTAKSRLPRRGSRLQIARSRRGGSLSGWPNSGGGGCFEPARTWPARSYAPRRWPAPTTPPPRAVPCPTVNAARVLLLSVRRVGS